METLEDLWLGKISPHERKLPPNSEQRELINLILQQEETLFSMLSEKAKETYDKLLEYQSELSSLTDCETFISGFRLGAKIMLEVMVNSD